MTPTTETAKPRNKPGPKPGSTRKSAVPKPPKPPKVKVAKPSAPVVGVNSSPPAGETEQLAQMSAADRENPGKLSGQPLKDLAHKRGLSRSELENMSDDKIRMQLRHVTARFQEEEGL